VAVHNKTVVTHPFKGGRLNKLSPVYEKYKVRELYNFMPDRMQWVNYRPKARMRVDLGWGGFRRWRSLERIFRG
jgi:hypothetical protein